MTLMNNRIVDIEKVKYMSRGSYPMELTHHFQKSKKDSLHEEPKAASLQILDYQFHYADLCISETGIMDILMR